MKLFKVLVMLAAFISTPALICSQSRETHPSTTISRRQQGLEKTVIARIWHGRTRASRADEYLAYLKEAGIKKIRSIEGNRGVQVLRRTSQGITEFTVISYWESIEAIRRFAGDDIEKTHNLPRDGEYLLELEPNVKHFEVVLDERNR